MKRVTALTAAEDMVEDIAKANLKRFVHEDPEMQAARFVIAGAHMMFELLQFKRRPGYAEAIDQHGRSLITEIIEMDCEDSDAVFKAREKCGPEGCNVYKGPLESGSVPRSGK